MIQKITLLTVALLVTIILPSFVFASDDTADTWTKKAPMQQARGGLGVAVVDDKIYAIGGCQRSFWGSSSEIWQLVEATEEYNPATDNWTTRAPMPTPRAYFAVSAFEGKIYCFGGVLGMGMFPFQNTDIMQPGIVWSNATEVYDPATDTWEKKAPTSLQGEYSIVVVDGLMYFMGTIGPQPAVVYNPATDSWNTTLASTSGVIQSWNKASIKAFVETGETHGDGQYALTAINGSIYAVSSSQSLVGSRALFIFNTQNQSWRLGSSAPESVAGGAAVATSGLCAPIRAYFEAPTANYVYDPTNDTWVTGAPLPTLRFDFGIALLGDKVHVIGGFGGNYSGLDTNEEYTPFGYKALPELTATPSPPSAPESNYFLVLVIAIAAVVASVASAVYYKRHRRLPENQTPIRLKVPSLRAYD